MHSDAELEHAADRCVAGGFGYAGQTCISVQRILVQRSVCPKGHALAFYQLGEIRIVRQADRARDGCHIAAPCHSGCLSTI